MAKRIAVLFLGFCFFFSGIPLQILFSGYPWRTIENKAFQLGEKLVYIVKWKGVRVGVSETEVRKIVKVCGRDAYYVTLSNRSSKLFDVLFKTRDHIESYIDREGIFSWGWKKRLRGGEYRSDKEVFYDQENHRGVYMGKTIKIPPYVQDYVSSIYYLRTQEFKTGDFFTVDVNDDGKNYVVEVKVLKRETVEVPAGKFDTLLLQVVWKGEGNVKKESSWIWVTDDVRKVPTKIQKDTKAGQFTLLLKEASF